MLLEKGDGNGINGNHGIKFPGTVLFSEKTVNTPGIFLPRLAQTVHVFNMQFDVLPVLGQQDFLNAPIDAFHPVKAAVKGMQNQDIMRRQMQILGMGERGMKSKQQEDETGEKMYFITRHCSASPLCSKEEYFFVCRPSQPHVWCAS
jgi:hypothetical protein